MSFSRVVVGLDGSVQSRQALLAAFDLVGPAGVVLAVSVEENLPRYAAVRGEVDEAKLAADEFFGRLGEEAEAAAKEYGCKLERKLLRGHAAQQIVDYARQANADLIVLGHSGHSGVWGTFLGTTADKIVRHAPCSVLVVRPKQERDGP
jgi:nucleotide-binding universal stress UspA family protein